MNDLQNNLRTLLATFNEKRVISEGDIKTVLTAIVGILAENKKSVDQLAQETKGTADNLLTKASQTLSEATQTHISDVLRALHTDYAKYTASLEQASNLTKFDIEKATKAQNDRAFKRLQGLIDSIKMPQNGKNGLPGQNGNNGLPGKDGSPDTAQEVRDKLETLKADERLDVSAIKGWDALLKKGKGKVQQMIVGGFRFLEQLYDVAVIVANKRQDMTLQYNITNNRWQDGIALTVGTTQPSNPQINDLWVDTN